MNSFNLLSAIVFCFLGGAVVTATDFPFVTEESDSLYGKGVHAFFDRDYEQAAAILAKAEKLKTNDPRLYYFLGLAQLRQKKTVLAEQSFKKAAQLEYSGRSLRDYAVSESLRQIQGNERMRIEKIREEARENAQVRERHLRERRYGRENATARENLRQNADSATLQNVADDLGDSAFGVKPIDPLNTTMENIVPHRVVTNPFGEVTAVIPVETIESSNQEADAPQPSRTVENPDVAVTTPEPVHGQTGVSANPVRGVQASAAKEVGRALGTLFSGKASTE